MGKIPPVDDDRFLLIWRYWDSNIFDQFIRPLEVDVDHPPPGLVFLALVQMPRSDLRPEAVLQIYAARAVSWRGKSLEFIDSTWTPRRRNSAKASLRGIHPH
jgi:hypothetical protein